MRVQELDGHFHVDFLEFFSNLNYGRAVIIAEIFLIFRTGSDIQTTYVYSDQRGKQVHSLFLIFRRHCVFQKLKYLAEKQSKQLRTRFVTFALVDNFAAWIAVLMETWRFWYEDYDLIQIDLNNHNFKTKPHIKLKFLRMWLFEFQFPRKSVTCYAFIVRIKTFCYNNV